MSSSNLTRYRPTAHGRAPHKRGVFQLMENALLNDSRQYGKIDRLEVLMSKHSDAKGAVLAQDSSLPDFRADCPCPKVKCERHGKCQECYTYHGAKGKVPRCMRGE